MNEHSTWFNLLPAYQNFERWSSHYLERRWRWQMFGDTYFTMTHVVITALMVAL